MAQYKYRTISLQSVFDLSVQLYGDISMVGNLIRIFPNLDNNIDIGEEISIDPQTDKIAKFFTDRRLKVATDIVQGESPAYFTADNTEITADSTMETADQTLL